MTTNQNKSIKWWNNLTFQGRYAMEKKYFINKVCIHTVEYVFDCERRKIEPVREPLRKD